jgi:hypothetical protein
LESILPGERIVAHDPNRAKEVQDIANEIACYMKQHAGGADTLEGVARWWITRQRLSEAEQKVREAVEWLYSEGLIHKRVLADGTVLYSPAKQAQEKK